MIEGNFLCCWGLWINTQKLNALRVETEIVLSAVFNLRMIFFEMFCLSPIFSFTFNNFEINIALMSFPGNFLHAHVWLIGKHEIHMHRSSISVSVGCFNHKWQNQAGTEDLTNQFIRPFLSNPASAVLSIRRDVSETCISFADFVFFYCWVNLVFNKFKPVLKIWSKNRIIQVRNGWK